MTRKVTKLMVCDGTTIHRAIGKTVKVSIERARESSRTSSCLAVIGRIQIRP